MGTREGLILACIGIVFSIEGVVLGTIATLKSGLSTSAGILGAISISLGIIGTVLGIKSLPGV